MTQDTTMSISVAKFFLYAAGAIMFFLGLEMVVIASQTPFLFAGTFYILGLMLFVVGGLSIGSVSVLKRRIVRTNIDKNTGGQFN